jgi:predicted transcriptional regulator
MTDPLEALILDLLESLAPHPSLYSEVMNAWRTSCPRLPVWEEAMARGFIERRSDARGALVCLTSAGRKFLHQQRGIESVHTSPGRGWARPS